MSSRTRRRRDPGPMYPGKSGFATVRLYGSRLSLCSAGMTTEYATSCESDGGLRRCYPPPWPIAGGGLRFANPPYGLRTLPDPLAQNRHTRAGGLSGERELRAHLGRIALRRLELE